MGYKNNKQFYLLDVYINIKVNKKIMQNQSLTNVSTTPKTEVSLVNANKQHKKYERFLNDIYTCIKQREFCLKRSSTPDVIQQLPKIIPKQQLLGLSTIQQMTPDTKHKKVQQIKSYKFKNFINNLDQQQRKVSTDNMNLLGLEVKKISYCQKTKKNSDKNLAQIIDETILRQEQSSDNLYPQNRSRKSLLYYTTDDFTCRKIGISHRDLITNRKKSVGSAHTKRINCNLINSRQKPKSGKLDMKRRNCIESNPIYENRIRSYKEMIFKLNFAHGCYVETEKDLIDEEFVLKNENKFKAWIGSGNNGNLIKSLLKRRFWWVIVEEKSFKANFIWTQLKNNEYFAKQQPAEIWYIDRSKMWGKQYSFEDSDKSQKLSQKKRRPRSESKKKQQNNSSDQFNSKIFTEQEIIRYRQFNNRFGLKSYQQKRKILELKSYQNQGNRIHNHLENNFYLGNKKALFYNLKQYYDLQGKNAFTKIPLTFHIKKGFMDIQYKRFVAYYKKREQLMKRQEKQEQKYSLQSKKKMRNVWIVKPGELTNRGHGITVIDQVYQLNNIMKREKYHENGSQKTFIVQLYIDRPLLYHRRKFDIRQYMLITQIHGLMRAYWFQEGYIRTSSYEFDIQNFDRQIHLTNDAVQKNLPLYGKFEAGNKLSFAQFQKYLDNTYPKKKYNFQKQIIPQMKNICIDAVKSSYLKLSPQRLQHNFEIFGMDFMIDSAFKPWLIEINTNPCLELCCPLVSRLIPQMVEQSLRLSLDIVFPPPCNYPNTSKHLAPQANLQNLNYELIFDEKRDGPQVKTLYRKINSNLLEAIGDISQDETYQDQGKDIVLDQVF